MGLEAGGGRQGSSPVKHEGGQAERQKIFIIPGPDLAYRVCSCKPCLRSIKTASVNFDNLAPGPACKSCLTKGICIDPALFVSLCTTTECRA
jgi:hypothetical protein